MFAVLSPPPHAPRAGPGDTWTCLSALEGGREAGVGHSPREGVCMGQAPLYRRLTFVPLSSVRGAFNLILNPREERPFAQGPGELVGLGFELGTVSSEALVLGEEGGCGGPHNPVTSSKSRGEWRGASSDWTLTPTSRPGRKPGFLLSLLSLKPGGGRPLFIHAPCFLVVCGIVCNFPPVSSSGKWGREQQRGLNEIMYVQHFYPE